MIPVDHRWDNRYATGPTYEIAFVMAETKRPEDKSLVVKSAVGEYLRAKDFRVAGDFYDELNVMLKDLLDLAEALSRNLPRGEHRGVITSTSAPSPEGNKP